MYFSEEERYLFGLTFGAVNFMFLIIIKRVVREHVNELTSK
jgi:hypothetical protein